MRRIEEIVERYRDFPSTVALETSAYCNSSCIMCAHRVMKRKKGFMTWSLFKDAVDECVEHEIEILYLSGFSEPFTDKDLDKKIAYASGKGIKTSIYTNGSLIDERNAKKIIQAGLDEIIISIDGFTPEVYNRIRVGLDFEIVAENIRHLAALRDKAKPRIVLKMVLIGDVNRGEVARARRDWGSIVDTLVVRQPHDWLGKVDLNPDAYTPHRGQDESLRLPCVYPFTRLYVYWDGTVPVCCMDYDAEGKVGQFGEQSLAEIWQSEKMNFYRNMHLSQIKRLPTPCDRCSYFPVWW